MTTATCIRCSSEFCYLPFKLNNQPIIPKTCESCTSAESRAEEARAVKAAGEAARQRAWERICPQNFRDTEPGKLPRTSVSMGVLRWTPERRRGLVLWGATRLGKSRTLYLLLAKLFNGTRDIVVFDSIGFSESVEAHQARFQTATFTKRLSTVKILAFDDVDKVKLSRTAGDKMFAVFSRRCDCGLPTIFTCNANGSGLEAFLPHGAPFVARIREFCDAVHF